MIAIDTNLLVYAHRAGCSEHTRAQKVIESAAYAPGGWGIALPSISEFWSVVTHPSCQGGPSSPEEASGFLRALIETGKPSIFTPGEDFIFRLFSTATEMGVKGVRIFDLQIGLTALDCGATELWTHDRGFLQIPGLVGSDPISTTYTS